MVPHYEVKDKVFPSVLLGMELVKWTQNKIFLLDHLQLLNPTLFSRPPSSTTSGSVTSATRSTPTWPTSSSPSTLTTRFRSSMSQPASGTTKHLKVFQKLWLLDYKRRRWSTKALLLPVHTQSCFLPFWTLLLQANSVDTWHYTKPVTVVPK